MVLILVLSEEEIVLVRGTREGGKKEEGKDSCGVEIMRRKSNGIVLD